MGDTRARAEWRRDGSVVLRFPDGFLWGTGISAHQTEGNNTNTDWFEFESAGLAANGDTTVVATDFYNRFREDIGLAAGLNTNAMKVSVEWARIEPEPGVFDEAAIAHYREVLQSMRDAGLAPLLVLHHFTNPLWLERFNWWEGRETPARFGKYCGFAAEKLGDLTDHVITINEPTLLAAMGYGRGDWPPRRKGGLRALTALSRLGEGHREAYRAIKAVRPELQVGPAVNAAHVLREWAHWGDKLFQAPANWLANLRFLEHLSSEMDFIGVQYYSRIRPWRVFDGTGKLDYEDYGEGVTDTGWSIWSPGIHAVTEQIWKHHRKPIYITENGIADAADTRRAGFITEHLTWLHRALRDGIDVRGYYHWATTDNFEWLDGFDKRFGLIEIDYDTLNRRVRESAQLYAQICASGELVVRADHPSFLPWDLAGPD